MSRHTRSKRNRQSRSAEAHRRRRVLGFGSGAGVVLAFGLGPLAAAPPAHADGLDVILDPIINAIAESLGGVVDPSVAVDLSTLGAG